jgi:hypothetical protein
LAHICAKSWIPVKRAFCNQASDDASNSERTNTRLIIEGAQPVLHERTDAHPLGPWCCTADRPRAPTPRAGSVTPSRVTATSPSASSNRRCRGPRRRSDSWQLFYDLLVAVDCQHPRALLVVHKGHPSLRLSVGVHHLKVLVSHHVDHALPRLRVRVLRHVDATRTALRSLPWATYHQMESPGDALGVCMCVCVCEFVLKLAAGKVRKEV